MSIHSGIHSMAAAQVDRYLLERAPQERSRVAAEVRPTITISRACGVPAREIADRLAKELHYTVFDREVLDVIQQDTRLADRILTALDQGKRTTLESWIEGYIDFKRPIVDDVSFHRMLARVMRGISLHGSAMIIGRGGNFFLHGAGAFRVRLIAPLELRIDALEKGINGRDPVPRDQAPQFIQEHTERRRRFVRRHFHADIDDPNAYDVVFNLRRLDPDHAVGLIVDAYRRIVG